MRGGAPSHAPVNPHFAGQGAQGHPAFVEFGPIVWDNNPAQSFGHIINMLPSNGYGISRGTEHLRGHGDLENYIRVRFPSEGAAYGFIGAWSAAMAAGTSVELAPFAAADVTARMCRGTPDNSARETF